MTTAMTMITTTHPRGLLIAAALGTAACGVQPIGGDDAGNVGVIPIEVQMRFDTSCALTGCHDGSLDPNLTAGASESIVGGMSSQGIPYVTLNSVPDSYLGLKILGGSLTGAPPIIGTIMPPGANSADIGPDMAVIIGWIAGSPLEIGGAVDPTVAGMDTGDDGMMPPMDTGDDDPMDETGDETEGSSSGGAMDGPYAMVQGIFSASCTEGGACHNGVSPPNLTPDVSFDEIVGVASTQDAGEGGQGRNLIEPGSADDSYLYQKISGMMGQDFLNSPMPLGGTPLDEDDLEIIATWINDGAMEDE